MSGASRSGGRRSPTSPRLPAGGAGLHSSSPAQSGSKGSDVIATRRETVAELLEGRLGAPLPSLLPRGFDLGEARGAAPAVPHRTISSSSGSSRSGVSGSSGASTAPSSTSAQSLLGAITGSTSPEYALQPALHPSQRARALATMSLPDRVRLMEHIEARGMWRQAAAALRTFLGAEDRGEVHMGVVAPALRTMLACGQPLWALKLFHRCAQHQPLAPELLERLLEASDGNRALTIALLRTAETAGRALTPAMYEHAIRSLAPTDWRAAVGLYAQMKREAVRSRQVLVNLVPALMRAEHRFDALPPVAGGTQRTGAAPVARSGRGACEHAPSRAVVELLTRDLLRYEAGAAPTVLLQTLHCRGAAVLAGAVLQQQQQQQRGSSSDGAGGLACAEGGPAVPWLSALALFQLRPTGANAAHLVDALALTARDPHSPTRAPAHVAWERCAASFDRVASFAPHEAAACASAIAAAAATAPAGCSWRLAAAAAGRFMRRSEPHLHAVPPLVARLMAAGRWDAALRVNGQLLAKRPLAQPTARELHVAVAAALMLRKWSTALFWTDRAHGYGVALEPSLYDAVFGISERQSWTTMLRVLSGMSTAGGQCTSTGLTEILAATSAQGHAEEAMQLLSASSNIFWMP